MVILGTLLFHMNFRVSVSISIKKSVLILLVQVEYIVTRLLNSYFVSPFLAKKTSFSKIFYFYQIALSLKNMC